MTIRQVVCRGVVTLLALMIGTLGSASAAAPDIVLYVSDVTTVHGNWTFGSATGAAGGGLVSSADNGWSTVDVPLAAPADFFEASFTATANTPYHVWLRLRASANSKYNDSVWVQFNDATDLNGSAVHRIGSTSGLMVNLENCSGCGLAGWGWQDKAWWLTQAVTIKFPTSGSHTIRVQTREDGVQIDQIVLSPSTYLSSSPGQVMNDSTIVTKSGAPPPAPPPPSGSTPYTGTPAAIPGKIQASNFDNGGEGVAYHDTTAGNTGGSQRSTDVDLEASSDGGNDVGWIAAGEWLNYTVNVASAGNYTAQLRVASQTGGASLRLRFNANGVSAGVSVPATGGWQAWTTVSVPVALVAGQQVMTLLFDTSNFNIVSVNLVSTGTTSGGSPAAPNSPGPADGSGGVTLPPSLSWQAAGATSYDVRLDTSNPPTGLWASNLTTNSYAPSPLNGATRYYWQVVAKNNNGYTIGPVWSFTTAGSAPPPPPPPSTSSSFRMMTWNIHHGYTTGNVYNLNTQVQFIVAQNPDVIALEEVQTWDENQPPKLKSLLEQMTGQTWTLVWAPVTSSTGTEGNVILTRLPVVTSTFQQLHATSDWTVLLSNRSVAQATVLVNSVSVNVFATHLDYATPSYRTIQEQQLMSWLWNFSGPRLVGGDFNSWWGESWITTMETQHTDTWHDVTGLQDLGYTVNQAVRFDYIFRSLDGNWRVTPTNIFVPVTSISDHNPVVADFRVQ